MSELPCRRSIRLVGRDYSRVGAYFVTICVQDRLCLFGTVRDGKMELSDAGAMVARVWSDLPRFCPGLAIDTFVVMPDHIHVIVWLRRYYSGLGPSPVTALTVGDVVGRFKSYTTHLYSVGVAEDGWPSFPGRLWHRGYYERVVRGPGALFNIRRYIARNPAKWRRRG